MAKRKSRKRSTKSRAKSTGGQTVGGHSYGGRKFTCYGKRVKAGRSNKKVARIFCARVKE